MSGPPPSPGDSYAMGLTAGWAKLLANLSAVAVLALLVLYGSHSLTQELQHSRETNLQAVKFMAEENRSEMRNMLDELRAQRVLFLEIVKLLYKAKEK
jgi:hypothetical protein